MSKRMIKYTGADSDTRIISCQKAYDDNLILARNYSVLGLNMVADKHYLEAVKYKQLLEKGIYYEALF